MEKKLTRSRNDRMVAGVCAGIGKYVGIDPTVIRIIWVILSFGGWGLIGYLIAVLIVPEENEIQ